MGAQATRSTGRTSYQREIQPRPRLAVKPQKNHRVKWVGSRPWLVPRPSRACVLGRCNYTKKRPCLYVRPQGRKRGGVVLAYQ